MSPFRSAPAYGPQALGAMYFGSTIAPDRSAALLEQFVDAGGVTIDTANNYPFWVEGMTGDESETFLGQYLATRGGPEDLLIATKIGARPRPGGSGFDQMQGLSASAVTTQIDGSLTRLGLDRVDLLYTHVNDPDTPLEETLQALDDLVRAGKVGTIGCSNLTLDRLREAHRISDENGWSRYEAIQMRHTYLTPAAGAEFWPQVALDDAQAAYAADEGMTVFAYAALLQGAYSRPDRAIPAEYHHRATGVQLEAVRSTAHRLGATANQVVLAYLMQALPSSVPVLGVSSPEQLREALDAVDLELDDQALATLRAARGLHTD
ncbi:Predicted oxidoreductase [Nakamurella panacisegetis]|uniref:Predicted oxidoreductase n=1 Tax=Nakamurella panacisegetis TaxID=1090615 RepID=A0A1H0QUN9_9ACTN|nr:aldo/keto reductase [Nakamurella panacisegetis]SDP21022.1 Predicted oxidoreductase [Nakamurella panacisegetis]